MTGFEKILWISEAKIITITRVKSCILISQCEQFNYLSYCVIMLVFLLEKNIQSAKKHAEVSK